MNNDTRRGLALTSWSLAATAVLVAAGCSRAPQLAGGPFDIDETPTVVRFAQPAPVTGTGWDLCFEFAEPGASDDAGRIQATFLTGDGGRFALAAVRLDRRGERLVSQVGRLVPDEARGAQLSPGSRPAFVAVELRAGVPLRLRGLRGQSVP